MARRWRIPLSAMVDIVPGCFNVGSGGLDADECTEGRAFPVIPHSNDRLLRSNPHPQMMLGIVGGPSPFLEGYEKNT